MRLAALVTWAALGAAADHVLLDTGFSLRADRHERDGEIVRLYVAGGVIEMAATNVVGIESEEPIEVAEEAPAEGAPPARPAAEPKQLLERAARKYGLPVELLDSIAAVESGYDPHAISPKGAIGLMQLMPATAARFNADPTDPEQNVDAAARHLRELLERYEYGLYRALAAYNAGPGAVDRHGWVPPYRETQLYVQRVAERFERLRRRQSKTGD